MSHIGFWRTTVVTVATVGTLILSPMGLTSVLANEDDQAMELEVQLEVYEEANALEAAVELITLAQEELAEEALAKSTPPEWPVIAAYVMNILEGPEGEYFDEQYALPTVTYGAGAIAYVEEIAGISAEIFAEGDVDSLVDQLGEKAEVEALLHLLVIKDFLLQVEIDPEVLATVAEHLDAALSLLQGEEVN